MNDKNLVGGVEPQAMAACPGGAAKRIDADEIECRSIRIRHPGSKAGVSIVGMKDGAGIWVEEEGSNKRIIAIYCVHGQVAVGLYGKKKSPGCALALSVGEDGEPYFQVVEPDGTITILGAEELKALAKKG